MPTGDAQIHNVDTVEVQQRSTSTEQAEDISSDEEISFQNEEVLQHAEPTPPVPVRRSGRERQPPAWFTSGQYELVYCHTGYGSCRTDACFSSTSYTRVAAEV
ncbi:hypothetical protein ACJMK2_026266 [Sinanodonta woodiana]|uniref:Uncharacterized protein n=2 Tax=Sinanodonta woodiana TaxID=1069815 RepID=A0ABD3XKQ7_SINWO